MDKRAGNSSFISTVTAATLALSITGAFTAAANAQSAIPKYDPDGWCAQVASAGGGGSETIKRGCMEMEQEAYNNLKGRWAGLPEKTRKWCDKVARAAGKGSYSTLQGCIEMESESRQENSQSQFKW